MLIRRDRSVIVGFEQKPDEKEASFHSHLYSTRDDVDHYQHQSVTLTNVVLAITVCEFTPQCLGRFLVDVVKKWVCLRSVADHHGSFSGMVCWGMSRIVHHISITERMFVVCLVFGVPFETCNPFRDVTGLHILSKIQTLFTALENG